MNWKQKYYRTRCTLYNTIEKPNIQNRNYIYRHSPYTTLWISNGTALNNIDKRNKSKNKNPMKSFAHSCCNKNPYIGGEHHHQANMIVVSTCRIIILVTWLHIFMYIIIKSLWRAFSHFIFGWGGRDCLFSTAYLMADMDMIVAVVYAPSSHSDGLLLHVFVCAYVSVHCHFVLDCLCVTVFVRVCMCAMCTILHLCIYLCICI